MLARPVTDWEVPLTVRLLYHETKPEKLLETETSSLYEVALVTVLQLAVKEVDAILVAALAEGGLKIETLNAATSVEPKLLNNVTLPLVLVVFQVMLAD